MAVSLNTELVARYDRSGPRYTSYPPATAFHGDFGEDEYRAAAAASKTKNYARESLGVEATVKTSQRKR